LIAAFGGDRNRGLHAYTYAGMYRDCQDVRIARQVSGVCGYDHSTLRIDDAFLKNFETYAEETVWGTDGTLGIWASHEVYLSRRARSISSIRVTGNYGSEILRGVTTFKPLPALKELVDQDIQQRRAEIAREMAAARRQHPLSFTVFKELPWHLFGRLNAAQLHLVTRSPYTDNELVALAYQAPAEVRRECQFWAKLIASGDRALGRIPTDRGYLAGAPSMLVWARQLYLNAIAKAEWYYEEGLPHGLATFDKRLRITGAPPFPIGTHKIESYRRWFRDDLSAYLWSLLSHPSADEVPGVSWDRARALAAAHRAGQGNYIREIGMCSSIALVQRLLVRGEGNRTGVLSTVRDIGGVLVNVTGRSAAKE
jgi:asparagine synthase (glutamine-hydrolysing)